MPAVPVPAPLPVGHSAEPRVHDHVERLGEQQCQAGDPRRDRQDVGEEVQQEQAGDGDPDAHADRTGGIGQQFPGGRGVGFGDGDRDWRSVVVMGVPRADGGFGQADRQELGWPGGW